MPADDPVTVLSEDECWSLLSSTSLGRLVTILGGKPEIFPVNFVTRWRTVLFRTAQGTKLYSAVERPGSFRGRRPYCRRRVERNHLGQGASAVGQRRNPRRPGSPVAVVARDVEASLRTGDRLGDHRPAVQVRSRAPGWWLAPRSREMRDLPTKCRAQRCETLQRVVQQWDRVGNIDVDDLGDHRVHQRVHLHLG